MSNINKDENMNLNEMVNATPIVGNEWMKDLAEQANTVVATESVPVQAEPLPTVEESTDDVETYAGPGLVINDSDIEVEQNPKYGELSPALLNTIDTYMAEMDKEAERVRAEMKEKGYLNEEGVNPNVPDTLVDDVPQGSDVDTSREEFIGEYKEAVVIIDKSGMGRVIDFTDDERSKLERSKNIKIQEVEVLDLQTIKTKKRKSNTRLKNVINNVVSLSTTPIVLIASGYTATMAGCSAHELIELTGILMEESKSVKMVKIQSKWSFIHSKIVTTSIGELSFNEFLRKTYTNEMETLIYGIICATYPEETDTYPIKCNKCGKRIEIPYTNQSLIRAEKLKPESISYMDEIITSSPILENAIETQKKSALNNIQRILLPVSKIIVDIGLQSAYDFINETVAKLISSKNIGAKYESAIGQSTNVRAMYIPDPEDLTTPFLIEDPLEIVETIYSLGTKDLVILSKFISDMTSNITFEYGIMDTTCMNKICNNYIASIPISIENILFFKWQRDMNMRIE